MIRLTVIHATLTDCEGNHHSETLSADGACKHTGRLEGYVRFNDGTGIADVELTISSGSVNISVRTDESYMEIG